MYVCTWGCVVVCVRCDVWGCVIACVWGVGRGSVYGCVGVGVCGCTFTMGAGVP